ncbi:MAG: hypothetical protein SFX18_02580 [Pirellulales bacterium]|nr:hypothetical protein [Pirellulales bacterium]
MRYQVLLGFAVALIVGCGSSVPEPKPKNDDKHETSHGTNHTDHAGKTAAYELMVSSDPAEFFAGKPAALSFMIHDQTGAMLKQYETVHEKQIHLILVREGLDHFAHVHPEVFPSGTFKTTFTFPLGGTYRLYADFKPTTGKQSLAIAQVKVAGDAPKAAPLEPNVPGNVAGNGLAATITIDKMASPLEAKITFDIRDNTGEVVKDLQPYLGAMGHLVVLSADGTQFVHAHPLENASAAQGKVSFEAHFPSPGLY